MVFGKKKKTEYQDEEEQEQEDDEDEDDDGEEELPSPPKPEPKKPAKTISKEEIGDMLHGHLVRAVELADILRRLP